jgi:hypothetical protein
MKTNNSFCKALIFGAAVVLCVTPILLAEKITVRSKKGVAGSIEVIGVTGDSLEFKGSRGTMFMPLKDFDEDSLIRIIKELGKLSNATSPAEASNPKPSGATVNPSKFPEVTNDRVAIFPEKYLGKTVRFSNAVFNEVTAPIFAKLYASESQRTRYVLFEMFDSSGKLTLGFLADKEKYAELLLGLERRQKIEVIATVGRFKNPVVTNMTYLVQSIKVLK